jgi:hypothetical protein
VKRPAVAIFLCLLTTAGSAAEPVKPQTRGATEKAPAPALLQVQQHPRVDDAAQILAPFGPRLSRMADSFYEDLGVDIHVVTRSEAQPSIEMQANQIFQQRRIGAGAPTGGVLILLNPKLGSARIEVGYTLEGGLTDLHMGRIARDQLAPYASYSAAGMASMDVLHYLRDHVYLQAALGNVTLGDKYRKKPAYADYEKFLSGGAGAKAKLAAVPADADLKRAIPKSERARYAPSKDPAESVAALLRVMDELAGDPTLELFTEGSQLMRKYYPFAPFEELQRLKRIEASKPLGYLQEGDYAVATSKKPAKGFVPILLHREKGLWRVDSVETWKNLFFNSSGNYYLRNSNTPYAFGLKQFGEGRYNSGMGAFPLGEASLAQILARADSRQDLVSVLYRGDYWLRNAFVFPQAYMAFESARRMAPKDPLVLSTFANRVLYLGFPELAAPSFEALGREYELDLAEAYHDMGEKEKARTAVARALKENPLDMAALQWHKFIEESADRQSDATRRAEATIDEIVDDPARSYRPVVLYFDPEWPAYDAKTTVDVSGTKVFDHSNFGVTLHNTSNRTVEIESVTLTSMGDAKASGLGDIKRYWTFPAGQNRVLADESVYFKKLWGFTVDTQHTHVRYSFRTCWHGVGTTLRQCKTQHVDTLPQ